MGKFIDKGLVPPDDPMFSTGPELFSRPGSSASSTTSASDTTGATQEASTSAKTTVEPEELRAGKQMMVGWIVQNVRLAAQSAGKPLGSVSPTQLIEMAGRGEIPDSEAIRQLRRLLSD